MEARKANALLARLERDAGDGCREDGMVLYLAGLVQRSAGELNDALVSLRQAERAFARCEGRPEVLEGGLARDLHSAARAAGLREVADSVAARYSLEPGLPVSAAPTGELLLLVEEGYVAHRAEQALHVPIFPEEVEGLEGDDEDGIAEAAARIAARMLADASDRERYGRAWSDEPVVQFAAAMEGAHILRLAWPSLRMEAARPAGVRVQVGDSVLALSPAGDLSGVMHDELEGRRVATLARMVARGVTKYLVTREVERKSEKEGGEIAGFLAGRIANFAANRTEQADLRSWSLLPDRVSLARARLPEGTHRVRIQTLGRDGEVIATEEVGEVRVEPGRLVVLSRRVFGGERE